MIKLICKYCNKEFSHRKKRKYCSYECSLKDRYGTLVKEQRECIICGNKFSIEYRDKITSKEKAKLRKTCSETCAKKASHLNDNKDELKKSKCIYCNTIIFINKRASHRTTICDICRVKYNKKKYVVNNEIYNLKDGKYFCLYCGRELGNIRKYCNKKCRSEYSYLIYINKYKANLLKWNEYFKSRNTTQIHSKLRRYILEKYNYKCANCGFSGFHSITGNSILEIHHIDGNKYNNKENNLIPLCLNCHTQTDNWGFKKKTSNYINLKEKYKIELFTPISDKFCLCCGKVLTKRHNKLFCSIKCQNYFNYLVVINKWKLGLCEGYIVANKYRVRVANWLKRYLLYKYNYKCAECGFGDNSNILQVHHIDGNFRNNSENNLIILCPNCHALTKNFKMIKISKIV